MSSRIYPKSPTLRIVLAIASMLLLVSCASTGTTTEEIETVRPNPDDPVATARQETIDAMRSLSLRVESSPPIAAKDSRRLEGWFDVSSYFSVLNHLNAKPGYVLDYFYTQESNGGRPFLYARKIDSEPISSLDDLSEIWGLKDPYKYLDYVGTDDTEESYFQYVALRIMGGQFYIFWHSAYENRYIVCDLMGLESFLSHLPAEVRNPARQLDLAPRVEIKDDTAIVRLVTFANWGGFVEETYTVERTFPHTFIEVRTRTLLPYRSNVTL